MKKFVSGLICGIIIMVSISGYALTKITAQYNTVKVLVDGVPINTRVVAVTEQGQVNGRNYVSAADIAKALGASVKWTGAVEIETPRTDLETVVKNCKNSCVMVYVYKNDTLVATGSGFAYNGYIITAKHVTDLGTKYAIFIDDEKYSIWADSLVKLDTKLDVSALKINKSIPSVKLGDSSKLVEGEKLVLIDSPAGVQNSIDECIFSGMAEYTEGKLFNLSEGNIEPGTSGGAAINLKSEIIGIITNGEGTAGSAIPINDIKPILQKLK